MPGLSRGLLAFRDLFITATFTLPEWIRSRGVRSGLINRPIRGDDLAAATRTNAATRRLLLYIQSQRIIVSHPSLDTSSGQQRGCRRSTPAGSATRARRYSGCA